MQRKIYYYAIFLFISLLLFAGPIIANEQFIIETKGMPLSQEILDGANKDNSLKLIKKIFSNFYLVERIASNESSLTAQSFSKILAEKNKNIVSMSPQKRMTPQLLPTDKQFLADQWYFQQTELGENAYGINAQRLWQATTGDTGTIVAVIDTGLLFDHYEFSGIRFLPGMDFISYPSISNDGDGRDLDVSDPGDSEWWRVSTWHGTAVTSLIVANMNQFSMTGLTPDVSLLPIRALGVGGGNEVDILEAMLWAAGVSIEGVPNNENPAKIINLSLGSYDEDGVCDPHWQQIIDYIVLEKNAIIVVAAGNNNQDSQNDLPANCNNVVSVTATQADGNKASFSNFGKNITIAAPGSSILVAGNMGEIDPGEHTTYFYDGTSFAAPMTSASIAALVPYFPDINHQALINLLENNSRTFNLGSNCENAQCGFGIIDPVALILGILPEVNLLNTLPEISSSQLDFNLIAGESLILNPYITALDKEDGELNLDNLLIELENTEDYVIELSKTTENEWELTTPRLIGDPSQSFRFSVRLKISDSLGTESNPLNLVINVNYRENTPPTVEEISPKLYLIEDNLFDLSMLVKAQDIDGDLTRVELIYESDEMLLADPSGYFRAAKITQDHFIVVFRARFYDANDAYVDSDLKEVIILNDDSILGQSEDGSTGKRVTIQGDISQIDVATTESPILDDPREDSAAANVEETMRNTNNTNNERNTSDTSAASLDVRLLFFLLFLLFSRRLCPRSFKSCS